MSELVGVVDAGGRGAVVAEALARDRNREVHVFPGNSGLAPYVNERIVSHPEVKSPANVQAIVERFEELGIRYADVCQDNALANGLSDRLREKGITVVGPSQAAACIESSKVYARKLGTKAGIKQPGYRIVTSEQDVRRTVRKLPDGKYYIKLDGLAEGKGAESAPRRSDILPVYRRLVGNFPDASGQVLIEDHIGHNEGKAIEEFSYYVWADGRVYKRVGGAEDNKKIGNRDQGPNTGGMGCSSPPYSLTEKLMNKVDKEFIEPMLGVLEDAGAPYQGPVYFAGAKLIDGVEILLPQEDEDVEISTVEWNARWGDPEAQVLIPGIEQDLYEIGQATANHELDKINITHDGKYRVSVAGASLGYPGDYNAVKGKRIRGLEEVKRKSNVSLYPASITVVDGVPYASGGRLFHIVGEGNNPVEARERAYEAMAAVSIDGNLLDYRTDIGWRDAQRYWMMQGLKVA